MDRHRGDRSGDRHGDRSGDRQGDRYGDGGRRTSSRWSSDSPTHQHHRFPRGGGGGGSEGLSSGGGGAGRYHPYRVPQDSPVPPPPTSGGEGFRSGGRGGAGGGGFDPSMQMGGPRRGGFSGRGGPPTDLGDGHKFAKLFIGSVPRTASEEDIRPLFEEHGDVVEVAFIKDRKTGEQQGCCFVKYTNSEEADRAIRALHNQYTLPGGLGPIQVRYADGEREHHGAVEDKLFVASLNKQATAKEIEEIFSPYGLVEDVYIMRDSSRQSRGCGFVKFASREMALAALKALNGVYIMRGCDQPLVVRFADPKRPRPSEPRGGPAFGGPGVSPRSEAALVIRPTANLEEPRNGQMPPDAWHSMNTQSLGPPPQLCVLGPTGGPTNGSTLSLSAPLLTEQSFNPAMVSINPAAGQEISLLQKPLMPSQSLPTSLKLNQSQQTPASNTRTLNLQAPMQQLGQLQSAGLTTFNQTLPSQQLPGIGGQPSTSQSLIQQNASSVALQAPLSVQQQAMPAIAQQQFPAPNAAQQLLQQSVQQFPSQLPQMLLQQQAQTLQSSFQSSQQAIIQLQQQLQLMQQQQLSHAAKAQSAWSGSPPTSSIASSTQSAKPSSAVNASPAVPLTCNWTEHTSPEGFKYYYNSITRESRWEKPQEFALFELQQQQQQKLLLLQQQQKPALLQLPSQSDTQSHTQVQPAQQVSQTQQVQSQMRNQQTQLQLQPLSMDFNYAQPQATGSVDHSRVQQGIRVAQEWALKNKSAGS
ncbi:flowering time control protein FCA-like isoform X1 [Musa acuminata AAA Group]|uniref:flowering time control protein FCA-like isoform X1 n=1 Tax=Musa acuminata AAA Group TaxID=214697 RepID=UPI0031DC04F2